MKLFGIVKLFDEAKGYGLIKPEAGGDELRFDKRAVRWGNETTLKTERRLSYNWGGIAGAMLVRSTSMLRIVRVTPA